MCVYEIQADCMYFTHKFVTCKNSNNKRVSNVKIQNTDKFWWCTYDERYKWNFGSEYVQLLLYIALIFYYILYMEVTI